MSTTATTDFIPDQEGYWEAPEATESAILKFIEARCQQEPDYTHPAGSGYGVSASAFLTKMREFTLLPFTGGLIREERIFHHFAHQGAEVSKVLSTLHPDIIVRVFKPSPRLDAAVQRCETLKSKYAAQAELLKGKGKGKAATWLEKQAEKVSIAPMALCNALAGGDLRAGALLYRIIWWMPYSRARLPNGQRCLVKTAEELAAELDYSPDQYDRARRKLVDLDLIAVEQHFTHLYRSDADPRGGVKVSHLIPLLYVAIEPTILEIDAQ